MIEGLYKRLLAFTRDGVIRYTFDDGRILMANQGYVDVLDLDCAPEDLRGKYLTDVFEYTEKKGTIRHSLEQQGEIHGFEYHFRTLKGEDKWVLHDSFIVSDPETGKRVVEAIVKDITFRKRTEARLRDSEEKYRNLVESARDGICIILDGKVEYANRQIAEMLGYQVGDVVGTPFTRHVDNAEVPQIAAAYEVLAKATEDTKRFETSLVHARGGSVDVDISASAVPYEGRRAVMVVIRDITERKRWERALRETERLEAVRALAGGVAHNFTNIINVIRGYATSISDNLLPNTKAHEYTRHILEAANHAFHLTKRIMNVADVSPASDEVRIVTVSLDRLLRDAVDMVGHPFERQGITVRNRGEGRMPAVKGDEDQLLDAVMNVLLNSSEAMPDGGVITIDTIERRIGRPRANPDAEGGVFVGLRIRDTGVGMSKEISRRAFEPFFTTKGEGMSFGLGLTIAQSTIQAMGGWMDIRGREGVGCTVRLFLPKAVPIEFPETEETVAANGRSVLVVDDRLELLTMMKDTLQKEGYTVHTASDAEGGVSVYKQHPGKIAVTVVDLLLPGEGGGHVVREILKDDPQANVIVTSGFSRDYVRGNLPVGAWRFLQKPFHPDKLVDSVNVMLGTAADSERE